MGFEAARSVTLCVCLYFLFMLPPPPPRPTRRSASLQVYRDVSAARCKGPCLFWAGQGAALVFVPCEAEASLLRSLLAPHHSRGRRLPQHEIVCPRTSSKTSVQDVGMVKPLGKVLAYRRESDQNKQAGQEKMRRRGAHGANGVNSDASETGERLS